MSATERVRDERVMQGAAAAALSAAAVKARLLAVEEERKMFAVAVQMMELQLGKLEAKLHHLEQYESILDRERGEVRVRT